MENKISCGGIICFQNLILLVRPTHQSHWGFPKGICEQGQQHLDTAIREIMEQTNIKLTKNNMVQDFGVSSYIRHKDLHLFRFVVDTKPTNLKCNSMFISKINRKQYPQIDGYKWVTEIELDQYILDPLSMYLNRVGYGSVNNG